MDASQTTVSSGDFLRRGFVCRDNHQSMVFGERHDGTLCHISEVPSGLDCNCVCPKCRTQLVARKGPKNEHHFGHYGVGDERPCIGGAETALHKFAKEELGFRRELVLPQQIIIDRLGRWEGPPSKIIRFDSAVLQKKLGEIVPDLIVRIDERDLLIEFAVTHKCDPAKIAKIKEMNLPAVEIDLSGLPRNASKWDIREQIIHKAPRQWLHNPKLEIKRRERELEFSAHVARLRSEYVAACSKLRSTKPRSREFDKISALGLVQAVGIEVAGFGCFNVPPQVWQATIIADAVGSPGGSPFITLDWALSVMSRRLWLNSKFSRLSRSEAVAIRDDGTDFEYPAPAIMAWATELSRSRILVPARAGDGWFLWNEAMQKDRQARDEARLDRLGLPRL
jgi:hypothetical protein